MQGDRKSIYWVMSVLIMIITPIVSLFLPVFVAVTGYNDVREIVFIPLPASIFASFVAFCLLALVVGLLYFAERLWVVVGSLFVTILVGIYLIILGIDSYIYLHEDFIENSPFAKESVIYEWADLEGIKHELVDMELDRDEKYIFEFNDGYSFEMTASGLVDYTVKSAIYKKAMNLEIPFEEY